MPVTLNDALASTEGSHIAEIGWRSLISVWQEGFLKARGGGGGNGGPGWASQTMQTNASYYNDRGRGMLRMRPLRLPLIWANCAGGPSD